MKYSFSEFFLKKMIPFFLSVILLLSSSQSVTGNNDSAKSLLVQHNNNFSFTIYDTDIQVIPTDIDFRIQVEGFESLQISSLPSLPFYTEISNNHIDSMWINDISWKPVLWDNSPISYAAIETANKALPTGDIDTSIKSNLPGCPIDYINFNTIYNPLSSIYIYPFQFKNGSLFYADSIEFSVEYKKNFSTHGKKSSHKTELIICPDEWIEEADLIQQLHQENDIESSIVTLSRIKKEIDTIHTYRTIGDVHGLEEVPTKYWLSLEKWDLSLAKQIQSFLKSYNTGTPADYITLLGDGSRIPPSFYSYEETSYSQSRDFYNSIVPTDFFYMSPSGGGRDLFLSSTVGRIPVRTKEELKKYIEKLYCYIYAQKWDWFSNISFIGGDLFHDSYVGEMLCEKIINDNNFSSWDLHTYFTSENRCNENSVKDLFENQSNGFVNLCAHGSGAEVRLEPGFFTSLDCINLPVSDELPIVFSYSCMNGSYDTTLSNITYEFDPAFGFPTSFGESLVLSKGGSIAYVGGSRVNYSGFDIRYLEDGTCEYSHPVQMDAMCTYFFRSIEDSQYLGDMIHECLTSYLKEQYSNDRNLHSFIGFTLLGDPVIPILAPPVEQKIEFEKPTIEISTTIPPPHSSSRIPVFLDNSQPISLSFSGVTEVWISDYLQPGTVLFNWVSPSEDKVFTFSCLPDSLLCFRFKHSFNKEFRYVFRTSTPYNASISHPYSTINEVYPSEEYPYMFTITNNGFCPLKNIESNIKIEDSQHRVVSSYKLSLDSLPVSFEKEECTVLTIPPDEGTYSIIHTISYQGDSTRKESCVQFPIYCNNSPITRLGIPCNKWYLNKLKQRIPVDQINAFYKINNRRFEYLFIPSHKYSHYFCNALLLFDHYWDHLAYSYQNEFLQTFSSNGGITIGVSANSIHDRNQRTILSFFGIPDIKYSYTNYSRHLEPLYLLNPANTLFKNQYYYVHSRANWEPLKEDFWLTTTESGCDANQQLLSSDHRLSLWESASNKYFLSCSFLTIDPEGKSDDTRLLFEDILSTVSYNMISLTTTFNE